MYCTALFYRLRRYTGTVQLYCTVLYCSFCTVLLYKVVLYCTVLFCCAEFFVLYKFLNSNRTVGKNVPYCSVYVLCSEMSRDVTNGWVKL
jgi:hypothetical protein